MKKSYIMAILAIIALLVVAGALTGCKKDTAPEDEQPVVTEPEPEPEPTPEPEPVVPEGKTIELEKFDISEADVTVEAGATVTWLNKGETKHKIVINNADKENIDSSEILEMDDEYSYTFEEAGSYEWVSGPFAGFVTGTVTVE